MATQTFTVSKQMMVDRVSGAANPGDLHIPLGDWPANSFVTRALLYAPISFSGMVSITSARLYFYVHAADGSGHVNGSGTVALDTRRKTADWSETSGGVSSSVDESWSGSVASLVTGAFIDAGDAAGSVNADAADGTLVYIDITETVRDWFGGSANYGLMVFAASETEAGSFEAYSRHATGKKPYIWIDYTTNTTPGAPTNASPTGDAVVHTGTTVTLSARHNDDDGVNTGRSWHMQLFEDDGTTLVSERTYDSPSNFSTFAGTMSVPYANAFWQWRARTKDEAGAWGPWGAKHRFKANSTPNVPTLALQESPTTDVKTLTPTFKVTHSDPDSTDTKAYKYQIVLETSAGAAVWDSGETSLGTPLTTVSKLYNGAALSWGTAYRWRARTQDSNGAWSSYSSWATFTTHAAGVPTGLSPSGVTVGGIAPTLSGQRASTADSLTAAQVQVYDSTGVTLIWDSGSFSSGVTSSAFSKAYGGTALAYSTSYKWRARVTSSVGGTSEWSSLQTFTTPAASDILTTAPIGPGITDLTPNFEFSRTNSFNEYQIVLYESDGTTVVWDSGDVAIGSSVTSRSITYPGTPALDYATEYLWKVRVSSDGGSTWGGGYTDLVSFTTDEAGLAVPASPSPGAWLGAPVHVLSGDSIANVTNGASTSTSVDTADYQEGVGSLALAITSLNGASHTYETVALDLSDYGDETAISCWIKVSDLTSVSTIRLRFTDSGGAYAEYDVKPGGTSWSEETAVKGSPTATSGTIDWSDITRVGLAISTSASVSRTIRLDDVRLGGDNPSFDFETSDGDTLTHGRVRVYAADQTTLVWDSGDVAGSGSEFSIEYGGASLTKGATYYWQARYTKSTGPVGAYSALSAFVLNAAPSAPTARTPATGQAVTTAVEYAGTFEDADLSPRGDTPSGYEVEVRRNSDDVLMHRLITRDGLVAGSNSLTRTVEGTGLTDEVEYKWRSRYADSLGEWGSWSSYSVVKPSAAPTVTITSPTGTISSPAITVTWTFGSTGGKGQSKYKVRIIRDSDEVVVYDTGYVSSSMASHAVPGGYLVNDTDYTIWVQVVDTDDLYSGADVESITSDWAAPDAVEDFSITAVEDESRLLLQWTATSLSDAEFSYYAIYRRELGDSTWTLYDRITNKATSEYSDYFAGHGTTYEYKVTVWKIVVGDVDVESPDSDIPYATLDPDSWFVIGADRDESHIFELPVYDETHTEPIQQEVFEPLGSRRKSIVRGKVLGAEGSLSVQWTDSERVTAKEYLRYISDFAGPHILKSPFGDVWLVEFAGPAKKYLGGGHLSVTLTWIEVQ